MRMEFAADDPRTLETLPLSSRAQGESALASEPTAVGGAGRLLNAPVRLLDLPLSVFTALRKLGIHVVGELCRLTPADLPASMRDTVLAALAPHGLGLQGEAAPNPWQLPLLEPLPVTWAQQPVDMLDLTQRARNALRRAGVTTLGRLCQMTPRDLLKLTYPGTSFVLEVRQACHRRGLFDPQAEALLTAAPMEVLNLPSWTHNILLRAGLRTVDQLCASSEAGLLQLPRLGTGSLLEVRKALARIGRSLQVAAPGEPSHGSGPAAPADPVTLADWLEVLLEGQPRRCREVLVLRYGLFSGQPLDREQVGAHLHLRQDWVRHLEANASIRFARLAPDRLGRLNREVAAIVRCAGGMARVAEVAAGITQLYPAQGVDPEGFARLALPHCRDLVGRPGDRWVVVAAEGTAYQAVVSTLEDLLAHEDIPIPLAELLASACARLDGVDPQYVEDCLTTAEHFRILWGERVFLTAWLGHLRSRLFVAGLREIGRPAHYAEVAARVRETFLILEDSKDHNVRAALRRHPQVHGTAAGIFWLKSWDGPAPGC